MAHGKYHPDEGNVQKVIILKEDDDGMFSPRDIVGEATGTVQDVNIVSSDIPLGGGGTGGVAGPVSIQDGVNPLQLLSVDNEGRLGINNFPSTQPVSGSVAVSNFPATQPVSGTVTVSNPTANPETGLAKEATLESLRADIANGISAAISNFPATQPVSGTVAVSNFPATQPVSGTVTVSNPTTSVSVSNFPATQAVTGTFWQATQPVSGSVAVSNFPATQPVSGTVTANTGLSQPLTDAQLRATPVPITGTVAIGSGAAYLYKGRASTLITPGRAGTTGQTLMTIWNGSAARILEVHLVGVDIYQTAVKAVTVPPPAIRFYRTAVAPTTGALLTKVPEDTSLTSDAAVVLRGDSSADRTSAASALTATLTGGALNQEYAPRLITAAGYEMYDKTIFFDQSPMILRPNEGLVLRLDYNLATSNPISDMWIANTIWYER